MKIKAKFRDGEKRTIKRFAFFPIQTNDGKRVWLEYYNQHQRFFVFNDGETHWSNQGTWSIEKDKS